MPFFHDLFAVARSLTGNLIDDPSKFTSSNRLSDLSVIAKHCLQSNVRLRPDVSGNDKGIGHGRQQRHICNGHVDNEMQLISSKAGRSKQSGKGSTMV